MGMLIRLMVIHLNHPFLIDLMLMFDDHSGQSVLFRTSTRDQRNLRLAHTLISQVQFTTSKSLAQDGFPNGLVYVSMKQHK